MKFLLTDLKINPHYIERYIGHPAVKGEYQVSTLADFYQFYMCRLKLMLIYDSL